MHRATTQILCFVLVLIGLAGTAAAKRVALVIGNSAYEQATPLKNPKNDADALADALKRLDFEVIKGIDLNRSQFEGTVRKFARAIRGADVALLFYAGHGLQVNGHNYLAPVDAKLADEADLVFETLKLEDILAQMERETRINLVFLDACRDNPLARNLARSMGTRSASVGRGLARVDSGVGTMIAFATEPGNVALDGKGTNSPFTEALLKHIETPDLDIAKLMRRVRKEVLDETSGKQVPWSNSSLTGDFVFASRQIEVEAKPTLQQEPKVDQKLAMLQKEMAKLREELKSRPKAEPEPKHRPNAEFQSKSERPEYDNEEVQHALNSIQKEANLKNYAEALKILRELSEQGVHVADYNIGLWYHKGKGVSQNYKEAARYYRKAADAGNSMAMHNLGSVYASGGYGVAKDLREASRWYRKAAETGRDRSMYMVGVYHANGFGGVAKDHQEAARWFRKAADKGHRGSMHNLGLMYEEGRGVAKDAQEAMRWYRRAADKGHGGSMHNLGLMYEEGRGVAKDAQEAVRWYRKAADKGNARAMATLAFRYANGKGVAKDLQEAVRWFRKAADKGVAGAMYNLGVMYESGLGVAKDPQEAVRWYRKATDKGDSTAMYNLGIMYDNGRGVSKDPSEAAKWVVRALEKASETIIRHMIDKSDVRSRTFRREVQRLLKEQGVYSGAIDGQFGPGTRRAIEALAKK